MEINDILVEVFTYLDLCELLPCMEICKRWKQLSLSNHIWKRFLSLEYENADLLPYQTTLPKEFESYYEYYKHVTTQMNNHDYNEATIHYLTEDECPLYLGNQNLLEIDYNAEFDAKEVNNAIQVILPHCPNIKRGDLVQYLGSELGVFIYNGKEMEILDYNSHPDGIGVIPATYPVPDEFPINYWNQYGYLEKLPFRPELYIDTLIENYEYIEDDYDHTWFVCNHIIFHIVIQDKIEESERRDFLLTSLYTESEQDCSYSNSLTMYILGK